RAERKRDHFPAMLLLQLQCFFQGVRIGFVGFIGEVTVLNPSLLLVDTEDRIILRHLLETDNDLHRESNLPIKMLAVGRTTPGLDQSPIPAIWRRAALRVLFLAWRAPLPVSRVQL